MFFLALHIAGNAAFLLLVRVGRGRRFDYPVVGLVNYATAAALAAAALAWQAPPFPDALAAAFGAANGAQYQATYILMYALYGLLGVAVTTSLLRLSVIVPVLASVALWGEWPTPVQGAGLLLAAAALPLLSAPARGKRLPPWAPGETEGQSGWPDRRGAGAPPEPPGPSGEPEGANAPSAKENMSFGDDVQAAARARGPGWPVLALGGVTVLVSGVGLLAAKAFAELDRPDQRPVYVLAVYAVATLLAALAWPWRARLRSAPLPDPSRPGAGTPGADGRGRGARSVALGVLVGAFNIGQIWVLLPALAQIPAVLAFPLAAAGGLALATLGARLLWRERFSRRAGIGIGLAMLAAALANVR
jgi:drug/metabolite transporter (DMT)-like permease